MLLPYCILLHIIIFSQYVSAQNSTLFYNIQRTLIDSGFTLPDKHDIVLISDEKQLYLVDFRNAGSTGGYISVTPYDTNLVPGNEIKYSSLTKDFVDIKEIYRVADVLLRGDTLFVLFAKNIFIFPERKLPPEIITLKTDCSKLEVYRDGVALFLNHNPSTMSSKDLGRVYYLDKKLEFKQIKQFAHSDIYLMYFNKPNYFEVMDEKILFLHAGEPALSIYDPNEHNSTEITFLDTAKWTSFSHSQKDEFTKLAAKDKPNKIFSEVSPHLDRFLSYNLRIDRLDSSRFLITYSPGEKTSEKNFQLNQIVITYDDESGYSIGSEYSYNFFNFYKSPDFNFSNKNKLRFCYLKGIRYELVLEPHASWHDRDAERIQEEQNQSLLNDNYDLCIYSARVR